MKFQQDSAAPHCANGTIQLLKEKINERIISRNNINWFLDHFTRLYNSDI